AAFLFRAPVKSERANHPRHRRARLHRLAQLPRAGAGRLCPRDRDSLVNSKPMVFGRLREIAPAACLTFHQADLRDAAALERIFSQAPIDAVIHFAGLKAVGESVEKPLLYYANNVGGTVELLEAMARHRVQRMVFSSSATVYGEP